MDTIKINSDKVKIIAHRGLSGIGCYRICTTNQEKNGQTFRCKKPRKRRYDALCGVFFVVSEL